MIGVGYRRELAEWLATCPANVGCLEITAEHFFDGGEAQLHRLKRDFRLFVHGLGLSLGTPGPLDQMRLDQFSRVVAAADPEWISEHVAFTRTAEVDLGHLTPVRPTREAVRVIVEHAREVADRCGKRLLLENITSHVRVQGELSETEFLNEVCAHADCDLLLDVTNLYINSRNHDFDPIAWLRKLDPVRIRQLHIVGYSRVGGRYTDDHSQPIQPELLELARAAVGHGRVQAVILERDADFPEPEQMAEEIGKLQSIFERN